jgi:hypothetical protein
MPTGTSRIRRLDFGHRHRWLVTYSPYLITPNERPRRSRTCGGACKYTGDRSTASRYRPEKSDTANLSHVNASVGTALRNLAVRKHLLASDRHRVPLQLRGEVMEAPLASRSGLGKADGSRARLFQNSLAPVEESIGTQRRKEHSV